jgi:hypothetical protein
MKNIVTWLLFVSAFLLAACHPSTDNPGVQAENSVQDEWQTYTSTKYHFTVQFPSAWQVMELPTAEYPTATDEVWLVGDTPPPPHTGARADIVFVFTQEDPSPSWRSEYFDDYQADALWLGDIQARRISGINKESLSSEMVILAKAGDHFLQVLPNQGEVALKYFDRVISSLRFDQAETQAPAPSATTLPESPDEHTIVFEGMSFTYPAWLAEGAAAVKAPAFVDPSGFMHDDHPEHVRFDFVNPYTSREPFAGFQPIWAWWLRHQDAPSPEIRPQIFIFPTREYAEMRPVAGERIEALKTILESNAVPTGGELPVLPTFNSSQDLRGQVRPLAFQGGRGLRFIARYSQEAVPVVNPALFYTFQGLTDDGSLYVAAFFPLYVPLLPDQIQVEDWDTFGANYRAYLSEITAVLDQLAPAEFTPDLALLDEVLSSLRVDPDNALSGDETAPASLRPVPPAAGLLYR